MPCNREVSPAAGSSSQSLLPTCLLQICQPGTPKTCLPWKWTVTQAPTANFIMMCGQSPLSLAWPSLHHDRPIVLSGSHLQSLFVLTKSTSVSKAAQWPGTCNGIAKRCPVCPVPSALLTHGAAPSVHWNSMHACISGVTSSWGYSSIMSFACNISVHRESTCMLSRVLLQCSPPVAPNDLSSLVRQLHTASCCPQGAAPCGQHRSSVPALPPVCEEVPGAGCG